MHIPQLGFCHGKQQIACVGEATSPCAFVPDKHPLGAPAAAASLVAVVALFLYCPGKCRGTVMTDSLLFNWVDVLTVINELKSD